MQKVIIQIVIFLLVFIGGIFGINWYFSSGVGDFTSEMDQATLPVIYASVAGEKINCMYGYTSDIDASLLRDSVTPMEGAEKIKLVIDRGDYKVSNLRYEVRSSDGSSLVEDGDITDWKETKDGSLTTTIAIRMQLKTGQDYILKLVLEGAGGVDVSYYTHIIYNQDMHVAEQIAFVKEFNDAILDKKEAESIQKYLECDANKTNNDLGKVDITSSFEAITFAEMSPKCLKKAIPVITDITEDVACMSLRYLISANSSGGNTEYYEVTENYKVRYTSERMYLLTYERTMNSLYDKVFTDTASNSLKLGISESQEVEHLVSEDSKMAAFVKARQLYLYDYQSTQIVKVFSFLQDEIADTDLRDSHDQHDIHLISIDKSGNLAFAVYGYMNRGRHEGENGILFYTYDREENQIEEIAFIPSKQPFSVLEEDVKQAIYMTKNHTIYVTLSGEFYSVNMETDEVETIMTEVASDTMVSSEDGHLVGIQESTDIAQNQCITVLNFNSGKKQKITAGKKEVIRVIGFVDEDLVYGLIKKKDIVIDDSSVSYYPMYKIEIMNSDGEVVKSYPDGASEGYVMSASVNKNVVELQLGRKSGNTFEDKGSDYIMSKDIEESSTVTLDYTYNTVRYKELYMIFPNYIYVTTQPEWNMAKEVAIDDNRVVSIEGGETGYVRYFVYANGKVVDSYNNVAEAIATADEQSGVVMNSKQKTVWENSGVEEYATVGDDVAATKVSKDSESMAACIRMILSFEQKEVAISELLSEERDADELLSEYLGKEGVNLTGCTLDEVMYYICQGHPVIAKNKEGRFVLLTSFNQSLLKYMDPVTGETYRESFSSMRTEFEEGGNVFYSYLK